MDHALATGPQAVVLALASPEVALEGAGQRAWKRDHAMTVALRRADVDHAALEVEVLPA